MRHGWESFANSAFSLVNVCYPSQISKPLSNIWQDLQDLVGVYLLLYRKRSGIFFICIIVDQL